MLVVRLLGPPKVMFGDAPLDLEGDAARLLYYLAAESRIHTRTDLLALLWPKDDERAARQRLSVTLYALRHDIGGRETLEVDGERLRLRHTGRVWVDALDFLADTGTDAAPQQLTDALALYHGAFLTGIDAPSDAFEDWLITMRVRLAARYLSGLVRLDRTDTLRAWLREHTDLIDR